MNCNLNMQKKLKKGPAGMIKRSSLFEKIANEIEASDNEKEKKKEKEKPKEESQEKPKEEPQETKQEAPQGFPQESPQESASAPQGVPQESPQEATANQEGGSEVPVEMQGEAPVPQNNSDMLFAVIDFLQQNPNPQDSDMHAFAEQNGFDTHQLETIVYTLATKMVNILRGGKMGGSQLDINSVDPNELEMGIQVEYEHTADPSIAKKIALDHLSEIPDYYTRLAQMEEQAKSELSAAAVPSQPGMEGEKSFLDKDEIDRNKQEEENEIPVGARNATEV